MEHFLCALQRMRRHELGVLFQLEDAQGDLGLTTAAVTQLLLVLEADLWPPKCWLIRDRQLTAMHSTHFLLPLACQLAPRNSQLALETVALMK